MYFSEIYIIFFLDSFFHFLYLFKMWEIFMPHPVYNFNFEYLVTSLLLKNFWFAWYALLPRAILSSSINS